MPQFGNTLLPQHTYVIVTSPLGDALQEAMRFPGAVSDTDRADNHYCVVEGDRLMWSGRSTVWRGKPKDYVATLVSQIRRTFPQLRNVRAEYAWTGSIGNTVHRMPQIGEITPGLWLLSGFGARGLNTTAMGGEIVARAIVDGDGTWQTFSPFALVWSGGVYGRVAQQVAYWSNRASELLVSRRAQRREGRRLRAVEAEKPAAVASELPPLLPLLPGAVSAETVAAAESPPVIAAEDAPEILLQPAPAVERAIARRPWRKKKREADPAEEAPPGGGA
jgi:FAD dependent oxidoreductase